MCLFFYGVVRLIAFQKLLCELNDQLRLTQVNVDSIF